MLEPKSRQEVVLNAWNHGQTWMGMSLLVFTQYLKVSCCAGCADTGKWAGGGADCMEPWPDMDGNVSSCPHSVSESELLCRVY